MKKKLLVSFACLLLLFKISAQNNYADSLRGLLSIAKDDTSKVWLLVRLGDFYQWSYPDSGILYAQEALRLAEKLNFTSGQINAYSVAYEAFSGKGNYPKALEASLKQLELSEKSGDSLNIIQAYAGVGTVYYYSEDYQRALYYYNKLKSNYRIFLENQWLFSGFLGETYFHLNQLDSALYYTKICYDLDRKTASNWPIPYFYLGEIYLQKRKPYSALDYYHRGINISIEKLDFLDGYIGIAGVFKKINLVDSAIYYARKAVDVVHDGSFPSRIIEASKILTDIYTTNHAPDSALRYMQIMLVAKDSLFSQAKQNLYFNEQLHQQEIHQKIEQEQSADRNRQNIIVLLAGLTIILIIAIGLWRKNIYKQKSYAILQKQKQEIDIQKGKVEHTLDELKTTQQQLIQSEKMASLGEITAGIAHEIQNPLNFVNNFSQINTELVDEAEVAIKRGNSNEAINLLSNLRNNEVKITEHGQRADAIVKSMMLHSRSGPGQKERANINALVEEYARLSFQGHRAKDKVLDIALNMDLDEKLGEVEIIPQDIGRVLLNLFNNAFYTVSQKRKLNIPGYEPAIWVSTKKSFSKILVYVRDNGQGIPGKLKDKIFQPFFTTKPAGQGTGLGLSLAYDIVKAHGGEIKVETREGEESEFIIQLPVIIKNVSS